MLCIVLWSAGMTSFLLLILGSAKILRMSPETEEKGSDFSKHGAHYLPYS